MAGSHSTVPVFALSAPLEAVRALADALPQPVAVIDRECRISYANAAAKATIQAHGDESHARCFAAFFRRCDPCPFCPAHEVFTTGCGLEARCGTGSGECERVQTFPVRGPDGAISYVLEIFEPPTRNAAALVDVLPAVGSRADRLGDLLGRSAAMHELFEMVRLVADSAATVLLQGESGTGKELVARTIHRLSNRRDHPFVVVDCGALPDALLESELFGHVKGAFTGAIASKRGLFEEADTGTIFLDEIADTSPALQAKLLRVVQEGEIKPVGSSRTVKVDVRVISATNKDLMRLCAAKAFREDLYYRLAVLPLTLPPLRDRRDDVALLAAHFVDSACRRHGRQPRMLDVDAVHFLDQQPWPGNVRELKHTIERAVLMSPGETVTLRDVAGPTAVERVGLGAGLRGAARDAVHATEQARIIAALRQTAGNRVHAARLLKISRASLYNKLKAYRIE